MESVPQLDNSSFTSIGEWYRCITIYLFIGLLGCFQFRVIMNNVAMNILVPSYLYLSIHIYMFLSGK